MPFVSEEVDRRLNNLFRRSQLNVKIVHTNRTIRSCIAPPHKVKPPTCDVRSCTLKSHLCLRTVVVYELSCRSCHAMYIGSAVRHLHTRYHEHVSQPSSAVFKHSRDTHSGVWDWDVKIICNAKDVVDLRLREAHFIRCRSPSLNLKEELAGFRLL